MQGRNGRSEKHRRPGYREGQSRQEAQERLEHQAMSRDIEYLDISSKTFHQLVIRPRLLYPTRPTYSSIRFLNRRPQSIFALPRPRRDVDRMLLYIFFFPEPFSTAFF